MAEPTQDAEAVFLAPRIAATPGGQSGVCSSMPAGVTQELLSRVKELLSAHEQSQGPLDCATAGHWVSRYHSPDQSVVEKPGTQIGPYKLLQQIGEGGMGVVYMAEQTRTGPRRVALKVIKPGMDTRQVIARFEAERQALALMDHPNIAKVLDAGTTDSGRRTS